MNEHHIPEQRSGETLDQLTSKGLDTRVMAALDFIRSRTREATRGNAVSMVKRGDEHAETSENMHATIAADLLDALASGDESDNTKQDWKVQKSRAQIKIALQAVLDTETKSVDVSTKLLGFDVLFGRLQRLREEHGNLVVLRPSLESSDDGASTEAVRIEINQLSDILVTINPDTYECDMTVSGFDNNSGERVKVTIPIDIISESIELPNE